MRRTITVGDYELVTGKFKESSVSEILDIFKSRAPNVKYASVTVEENDSKQYAAKDGKITAKESSLESGARAHVVIEPRPGSGQFSEVYAHTDRTSNDGILKLLTQAASPQAHAFANQIPKHMRARLMDGDVFISGNGYAPFAGLSEKTSGITDKYEAVERIPLGSVPESQKEELLEKISTYVALDPHLRSGMVMYGETITTSKFVDTDGSEIDQRIPQVQLLVDMLAKADSQTSGLENLLPPADLLGGGDNPLLPGGRSESKNYRYFEKLAAGVGGYEIVEKAFKKYAAKDRVSYVAKKAAKLAGADSSPSRVCNVIMDGELAGVWIHEALGHICELDSIVDGNSKLMDRRMNDQIASPLLNVYEDPRPVRYPGHSSKTSGTRKYDDEGVPTKKFTLVKDGKLSGYLSSRREAAILEMMNADASGEAQARGGVGDNSIEIFPGVFLDLSPKDDGADPGYVVKDAKSSGHSRAQDWSHRPQVRMANTQVAYRSDGPSLEKMAEELGDGIYAKGSLGGYVDTTNGNFVFWPKEVYRIEDGKICKDKPIKDIVLTDNTLSSIKKINDVGNLSTVDRFQGQCGKGAQYVPVEASSPALTISSLVVQERVSGTDVGSIGGGKDGYDAFKNQVIKNNGVLYSKLV